MRWSNLDSQLKKYQPEIKRICQEIVDDCVDSFNLLGGFDELNNPLSEKDKRMLSTKLKEAKENNFYDYLLLLSYNVKTKRQFLLFLANFSFITKISLINMVAYKVFRSVSNESVDLANAQSSTNNNHLEDKRILELAKIPSLHLSLEDYLFSTSIVYAERIVRDLQAYKFDDEWESERLAKALINVNKDKRSGVIHDVAVSVANQSYVEYLLDNTKVKFVAIEDDRTTKMCNSLDGQIFYVGKENTFKRYSESQGGIVEYKVKGLVTGINLPPIADHIHRCRSYIEIIKSTT